MQKTALITGSTGDIGGVFTEVLYENGYTLYLPVRDIKKLQEKFPYFTADRVKAEIRDLTSFDDIHAYISNLDSSNVLFDGIILSAGGRAGKKFWDSDFEGDTSELQQAHAINTMREVNVRTKETFITALREIYTGKLSQTVLIPLGSHAADFYSGHPFRVNEEGYVRAMQDVRSLSKEVEASGSYKKVLLVEPGQVEGDFVKEVFAHSGITPMPKKELAQKVLSEAGLI